jgi:hypothetical protein
MGMSLDIHRRAALIAEVEVLVERVRQRAHSVEEARKVLDMTNFALNYLRHHTPDALRVLLDTPHATTTVQNYWQNFGAHLRPTLDLLEATYTEPDACWKALLYLLGWLHRVHRGPVEDGRRSPQPLSDQENPSSRSAQPKRDLEYRPPNRPGAEGEFSVKLGSLLNQQGTPSPAPSPTYRQGQRMKVTVVTAGINGVVRLPDGAEIHGVSLIGAKVGATITVRIIDVTSEGRVKRVVR